MKHPIKMSLLNPKIICLTNPIWLLISASALFSVNYVDQWAERFCSARKPVTKKTVEHHFDVYPMNWYIFKRIFKAIRNNSDRLLIKWYRWDLCVTDSRYQEAQTHRPRRIFHALKRQTPVKWLTNHLCPISLANNTFGYIAFVSNRNVSIQFNSIRFD